MDVKEAVRKAKHYVSDVFADEAPGDLTLEEVVFDDEENVWRITVGFFRPVLKTAAQRAAEALGLADTATQRALETLEGLARSYKIVTISDDTGRVRSVRNRELV